MTDNEKDFYGLGIAPGILEILKKLGFKEPTPIQAQSIPIAIEGKDLMGIAQTGTGKTLAFGIPLIQRVLALSGAGGLQGGGLGLVVAPTRELALQIEETLRKVGISLNLRTATLIGGESITRQIRDLHRNPQIIVGTPGRIIDHMKQRTVSLKDVSVLVLDEADRMLDMGFAPQLKQILFGLPQNRQTMLFSATMPEEIIRIAKAFLKLPIRVEIARSGTIAKEVTQELFFVSQPDKPRLLEKILYEYKGSVLVFSRTKFSSKRIASHIRALGHTAAEIHSNRSLKQRQEALQGFKSGRFRVLVATDIASRGIDVTNIELVLNYDLPENPEDYVHRIGRTARAGLGGHAISFARGDQRRDVITIERLIKKTLPISKIPELPSPTSFQLIERPDRGRGRRFPSRSKGFSNSSGPSSRYNRSSFHSRGSRGRFKRSY